MSEIEKRPLGNSGLKVAPLALGGNVFGWTADKETSFRILDAFVDAGGTMIDTADVYSAWVPGHVGGESETVIGEWLKRDPSKRDRVVIATKVGFMAGLKPESIGPTCDASLRRLGVETIDLYYQHKDDESVPLSDSLGAFEELRKRERSGRPASATSLRSVLLSRSTYAVTGATALRTPCRIGTIWSNAENMRERSRTRRSRPACRNFLITASPTAS
jgi:aryl-alcohol dehydrogenase-like predicted oxidoreductase